jgi:hypothetical protein
MRLCENALAMDDCALAITVLERLRRYSSARQHSQQSIAMAWLLAYSGRPLQAGIEAKLAGTLDPASPELVELRAFLHQLEGC